MISRRRFLKTGAAATFVSGAHFTGRAYAQGAGDLGVATGASAADIQAIVRAALAGIGGMERFVPKGSTVLLKPNLSFASPPERVATTNPGTLKAVIALCLEAGADRVLVVDHPLQDAAIIGDQSAVAQAVKDTKGASLILPTTEALYEETAIPKGKIMKSTRTVKIMKEADVIINLPVAKSHSATGVSLGIKGNLGLVWDRMAYHNSADFFQSLADLATVIPVNLTIIDAINALTTRGPQGPGQVAKLNTIVAGADPVATDSYAVSLTPWYNAEITGANVGHLTKSEEMGLGVVDYSKLNVVKTSV